MLFVRSIKFLYLVLFPLIIIVIATAPESLNLWLGSEFAQKSARVLQWLAVMVFINSMSLIPFSLLQGIGRPDITAKLHLLEVPFYVLALWWLTRTFGFEGAAIASVIRLAIDAGILYLFAWKLLKIDQQMKWSMGGVMAISLLIQALAFLQFPIVFKFLFLLVALVAFSWVGWCLILSIDEQEFVRKNLKTVFSFIR